MPAILQLDLQQILSQAISFVLLVLFLRAVLWKRVLGILDARRHRIEEELRHIAQSKTDLARLQEEYGKHLAKIEEEARAKIQQAILEGKRIGVEIQEQARAQSQALMTKSKEAIELELAKAKVTLRDEMAGMTVEAVERLLRQKLDARADRQLINAILDDLEQQHARRP